MEISEILTIYLAFSLSGGIVTYWTVLREAADLYESIAEEQHNVVKYPIIYFLAWIVKTTLLAPGLAIIVVSNSLDLLRANIVARWLENAGYND